MRERHIKPSENTVYGSLARFLEASGHPSGVLTVMHRGVPIDIRHEPRGYDTTTVFFHPAVSQAKFPVFIGGGISESLPTNRIFISDPSLYLDDELRLAWYARNHRQDKLQWAIRGMLRALIPTGQRVVMFGASGGGFAALYYAAHYPGAIAVPVNPQIDLANYGVGAVDRYGRLGWGLTGANLVKKIPAVTDLRRLYRQDRDVRVFYLQNLNDRTHMSGHFEPLMKCLPGSHSVHPALFRGPEGHHPPAKEMTTAVLSAAIDGAETPPAALALHSGPRSKSEGTQTEGEAQPRGADGAGSL